MMSPTTREHVIVFGASVVATLAGLLYLSLLPNEPARYRWLRPKPAVPFPHSISRPMAGLENVIQVAPDIVSGSEPDGEAGFESLKHSGIKTVVSVDGIRPNVALAEKFGLGYVHIPLSYSGVPHAAAEQLAAVLQQTTGPWYVHCHHGKHRGPAAAAIVAMSQRRIDATEAVTFLELAGTSRDYPGLWRDVCAYQPLAADHPLPDVKAVADVPPLAEAMANIDRLFDRMKDLDAADLSDDAARVDAVLLQEEFREALRVLGDDYDAEFRERLSSAERTAEAATNAIRQRHFNELRQQATALEESCRNCHEKYRNAPN